MAPSKNIPAEQIKVQPGYGPLELSQNAIHTPTNVLDKAGTRVSLVLYIDLLG